jgi:hypothetical protein
MDTFNGMAMAALLLLGAGWYDQREPRLEGASMYDLWQSSEDMKEQLRLSPAEADELDGALDLLIGEETRELRARTESPEDPPALDVRMRAEARLLAPVDGLSFDEVIAAAHDRLHQERLASVLVTRP